MENKKPSITTVDGSPDLSEVQPGDQVSLHVGRRPMLVEANKFLTDDRQPITDLVDDGTYRLLGEGVLFKMNNSSFTHYPERPPSTRET